MIGEDGLEEELGMVGLKVVKEAHRPPLGMTEDEFREGVQDPEVMTLGCRTTCVRRCDNCGCLRLVLALRMGDKRHPDISLRVLRVVAALLEMLP